MALQQQESKQLKSGEEERFLTAIQDSKIFNADLEDLKSALKNAMVKVGLRSQNWPEEEEKALLIAHVIKEFGNHTVKEIIMAFDLAIDGQLIFHEGSKSHSDATCYENFSCIYFSKIMNAYRVWASNVYNQHRVDMNTLAIEYREDTSDAAMNDWLAHVKQTRPILEFLPLMLYDWLDRKGVIQKTKEEKYGYLQRAVSYRQSQLAKAFAEDPRNLKELQAFNEMKEKECFEGVETGKLKDLAKRLILQEYINEPDR